MRRRVFFQYIRQALLANDGFPETGRPGFAAANEGPNRLSVSDSVELFVLADIAVSQVQARLRNRFQDGSQFGVVH